MKGGGPRTREGRERIAAYQRERWRRFREQKAAETGGDDVVAKVWSQLTAKSNGTDTFAQTTPSQSEAYAREEEQIEELPWQRNRRLRQEQVELENEHGRDLLERYEHGPGRPNYAAPGYPGLKRRRR